MPRYAYDGPVMAFDYCVSNRWKGETLAPSEAKARSNLLYQYKREHNHSQSSKLRLPGKIRVVA